MLVASLKSECVFSAENTVTQNRASLNSEKVKECVTVTCQVQVDGTEEDHCTCSMSLAVQDSSIGDIVSQ